jgi:Protein of unknown function (DUF1320)
MRPVVTEADLWIGAKTLESLLRARATAGGLPAVHAVLEAAEGLVHDYTARYALPPERWRRLVRALAVHDLMAYPGAVVPPAVVQARADALAELRDIRDGRFRDVLPVAAPADAPATDVVAFGSSQPLAWPARPANNPQSSITP